MALTREEHIAADALQKHLKDMTTFTQDSTILFVDLMGSKVITDPAMKARIDKLMTAGMMIAIDGMDMFNKMKAANAFRPTPPADVPDVEPSNQKLGAKDGYGPGYTNRQLGL